MTSCCLKVSLHEGEPKGHVQLLNNISTYVVGDASSGKVLIFLSDVFGIPLLNNKLLADAYAGSGYLVLMPDLFNGNSITYPLTGDFDFPAWKQANEPSIVVQKLIGGYLEAVKTTYNPKFIVANGYCYGARVLAELIIEPDTILDAGAVFHASLWDSTLISKLGDKPLFIAAAETDSSFTEEVRHLTESTLKEKKAVYFLTLASGVQHGFAVKGDLSKPEVKFAKEKAFKDSCDFFEFVRTRE